MKINLIVCFYDEKNNFRRSEIIDALNRNIQNSVFDVITLVMENTDTLDSSIIVSDKVNIHKLAYRVSFLDLFYYFKSSYTNIIANNDIVLKLNGLSKLKLLLFRESCIALTRFELDGTIFRKGIGDSQDTWIYGSKLKKESLIKHGVGNYHMGLLGCDNRILFELYSLKVKIFNLPWDFKTIHNHLSGTRNYSEAGRLDGNYMIMVPTRITSILFLLFFFQTKISLVKNYLLKKGLIKEFIRI